MKVTIQRLVPKGEPNPNIGKPYSNMEAKLKEYFNSLKNRIPVVIRDEEDFDGKDLTKFMSINPTKVIGYATSFSDSHMILDIQSDKEDLFNSIPNPRVEIVTIVNTENKTVVERIVKLGLTSKGE